MIEVADFVAVGTMADCSYTIINFQVSWKQELCYSVYALYVP
jgi:hypothetical protein